MTQRYIDSVAREVDHLRRRFHPHFDLRIQLAEATDSRHQPRRREGGNSADGEGLFYRQRLQGCQRFFDLVKAAQQPRVHTCARLGEVDPMAPTHEQRHTDALFKQAYLLTDRPRRDPQALRCSLQTSQAPGFGKGTQCEQG
ncbi:hypothetical protein D3C77_360970 [compost metagenome]